MIPLYLAAAFTVLAWAGVFVGFRNSAQMKHNADRMRSAADFYEWGAWTCVSVVDRDGQLHHWTLPELRDWMAGCPDAVWGDPKAAIIYTASADDPDPYGYKEEAHRWQT